MFNPKVVDPTGFKTQTMSAGFQAPFNMGGSQVPVSLGIQTIKLQVVKGRGLLYHKDGSFLNKPLMK